MNRFDTTDYKWHITPCLAPCKGAEVPGSSAPLHELSHCVKFA